MAKEGKCAGSGKNCALTKFHSSFHNDGMFRGLRSSRKGLWITGAVGFAVLAIVAFTCFSQNSSDIKPSGPPIAWTPSSLSATVSAGASNTFNLSFVASEDLGNVTLRVVPELQPFVQVVSSGIPAINRGQTVTVNIIVTTPATMLPQTLSGAIQVRDDQRNGTISAPLPVTIAVQWQQLREGTFGFQVTYPPMYIPTVNSTSGSEEVGFSENQDAYSAGVAPIFVITSDPLPGGEALRDWIHSFGVADANISEVTVGGMTYLKWFESGGEGDANAVSYSVTAPNGNAVTVTVHSTTLMGSSALNAILSSLTFFTP